MGNDASKKTKQALEAQRLKTTEMTSRMVNERAFQRSPLEDEMDGWNRQQQQNSQRANDQAFGDYGDMMGNYKNMYSELSNKQPTQFSWNNVKYERPEELGEAYGYLREGAGGYREFAKNGGYSEQDVQELRARGMSPIRSAYANSVREMDRARSIQGGAANYIAARSRAQRELPGQMADAMTNVNAGLAEQIRNGKLAGLSGLSGIGATMGGLSDSEASKILQANLANSQGNLQAAGMTEGAYNNWIGNRMGALNAQQSLYGTTPGMANMFGNQAMQGMGMRMNAESNRNNFGLGLIDANMRALNNSQDAENQKTPWWRTALNVAGTVAPYAMMAASDRNLKTDIHKVDEKKVLKGIKNLNLYTWKYKGDKTTHMGPMAQGAKKFLGVGDGKTLHMADIMGVMLATSKAQAGGANV